MKANSTVAAIPGAVCGGLAHAASATGSAAPAPAVIAPSAVTGVSQLHEVIVTANRRVQNMQDVSLGDALAA